MARHHPKTARIANLGVFPFRIVRGPELRFRTQSSPGRLPPGEVVQFIKSALTYSPNSWYTGGLKTVRGHGTAPVRTVAMAARHCCFLMGKDANHDRLVLQTGIVPGNSAGRLFHTADRLRIVRPGTGGAAVAAAANGGASPGQ